MAIKITPEEYQKKFGATPSTTQQPSKTSFIDRTKQAFSGGVNKVKDAYNQPAKNPLQFAENVGKLGAGLAETAFSPVTAATEPVIRPTVGRAINYAADKISNNPSVQKFATSKAGEATSRVAQTVSDYSTIAGAVAGPKTAKPIVGGALTKTGQTVSKGLQPIKQVTRDVVPTVDRVVNANVTKSLDFTSGDASNFFQNTGQDVGRFVADHNLIRTNKDLTSGAIKDFFDTNYKGVRSEISKVKTNYKPSQVPRYVESLKAIKREVDDVPGLEKSAVEVDNLLNKRGGIVLDDVQRTKELLDKYHAIYQRSGDVKDATKAQGLNNIRSELKTFIEGEVKKNTGTDIGEMNAKVSGSKQLLDMIEVRSPRGLTKSNLKMGDWATMGAGAAITFPILGPLAPLGGIAALFVKKAFESPAIMLRIAKKLDSFSDARKLKIKTDLEAGKIPTEFQEFIKKSNSSNIPKSDK